MTDPFASPTVLPPDTIKVTPSKSAIATVRQAVEDGWYIEESWGEKFNYSLPADHDILAPYGIGVNDFPDLVVLLQDDFGDELIVWDDNEEDVIGYIKLPNDLLDGISPLTMESIALRVEQYIDEQKLNR